MRGMGKSSVTHVAAAPVSTAAQSGLRGRRLMNARALRQPCPWKPPFCVLASCTSSQVVCDFCSQGYENRGSGVGLDCRGFGVGGLNCPRKAFFARKCDSRRPDGRSREPQLFTLIPLRSSSESSSMMAAMTLLGSSSTDEGIPHAGELSKSRRSSGRLATRTPAHLSLAHLQPVLNPSSTNS